VFSQQYNVHFEVSGVEYDPLFHSRHNDRDMTEKVGQWNKKCYFAFCKNKKDMKQ